MKAKDQDTMKSFIRWFRRCYWSLGGVERHLEVNYKGDFKVDSTAIAYEAYLAGIKKGNATSSPKTTGSLQKCTDALQEIIGAADGTGWNQLDASFTKAREAVKVSNKIVSTKESK